MVGMRGKGPICPPSVAAGKPLPVAMGHGLGGNEALCWENKEQSLGPWVGGGGDVCEGAVDRTRGC